MIATIIKKLRTDAGISQEQMAKMLDMTRITYNNIEIEKREPKPSELQKIADFFETSVSELVEDHTKPKYNKNTFKVTQTKLTETILYILSQCGAKPNFWKIVLNKLLYFIDFNYHEKYHESITGQQYIKLPMWPVPKDIDMTIAQMKQANLIEEMTTEYFGHDQTKYMPLRNPDMTLLSAQQLMEIDDVIMRFGDKNGRWLTDFSHGDIPWKVTKEIWQEISYGLAHYREGVYRVTPEDDD